MVLAFRLLNLGCARQVCSPDAARVFPLTRMCLRVREKKSLRRKCHVHDARNEKPGQMAGLSQELKNSIGAY